MSSLSSRLQGTKVESEDREEAHAQGGHTTIIAQKIVTSLEPMREIHTTHKKIRILFGPYI
jgi:hypothetical protein